MANILIIDDEKAICSSLSFVLEDEHQVWAVTDPEKGLGILQEEAIDCVLLDQNLGSVSGLDLLRRIKDQTPDTVVIMMTAYGTIESSIAAIKAGAYHYLTKPLNLEEVKHLLQQALNYRELNKRVRILNRSLKQQESYAGIIGKSEKIRQIVQLIEKVKDIQSHVLITGESGTGKELVARAIHYQGIRRDKPFLAINCAAIPESLLESELFGYEKGAFTGAVRRKEGLFQRADGGTLFLDEIGEMSLALQAKILRVLQDKVVTPLGSSREMETDVRIIAATNRNLREEVAAGNFREDLYYRINVIPIHLPPLRERMEDVPLLAEHFLSFYSAKLGKAEKKLSQPAKRILYEYPYPGNVRELANIIEYAVAMSDADMIRADDLPSSVRAGAGKIQSGGEKGLFIPEGLTLKEAEKLVILHALDKNGGNRQKTAKQLGISERGLREKLKIYLKEK